MQTCCGCCCRTPRYKRLVDSLFPVDPQCADPVTTDLEKLLYLARSEPDRLDDVGAYLANKQRRAVLRDRRGHVQVSLKVMEKLLSEVNSRQLQLLAGSYLDMLHEMLQSSDHDIQIMAAHSFVSFTKREEENPPYHRQYDFFIERFAAMCLVKQVTDTGYYVSTRLAGLRALQGVVRKVGPERGNIWDSSHHLNKIVPAFLINIQAHGRPLSSAIEEEAGGKEQLAEEAKTGIKELMTAASVSHATVVIQTVLLHFDLNNVWLQDYQFASDTSILITQTMQPQFRYIAVQALLSHLDKKQVEERKLKRAILEVLSKCVPIAAYGSIGPSVLDVFRTLVKHLCNSIQIGGNQEQARQDGEFHETVVRMVGQFAAVLADYHNPDIMNLIYSYLPIGKDGYPVLTAQQSKSQSELVATLVKSLRAVADSSKPSQLETALTETLLISLAQLMEIEESNVQLDVLLLWHTVVDHHGNKPKLPLNTIWEDLESLSLLQGKVSFRFLQRCRKNLYPHLISLASGLAPASDNMVAFYQLLCLLALEFGYSGVGDMVLMVDQLQQLAVTEGKLQPRLRSLLHSSVAGVLYLLSFISDNDSLQSHVAEVISSRRSTAPYLLPDTIFGKDMVDGGKEKVKSELLFHLREKGLIDMSSEMMRNPSIVREHSLVADHNRSFRSHSVGQIDRDVSDEITFDRLKEGDLESSEEDKHTSAADALAIPSFEEMIGRVSQNLSLKADVDEILKSASPRVVVKPAQDETIFDMELNNLEI